MKGKSKAANEMKKQKSNEINSILGTKIDFTKLSDEDINKLYDIVVCDPMYLLLRICRKSLKRKLDEKINKAKEIIDKRLDRVEDRIVAEVVKRLDAICGSETDIDKTGGETQEANDKH